MKQKSFIRKTACKTECNSDPDASAGPNGIVIVPPDYGMDFVDGDGAVERPYNEVRGLLIQPKLMVGLPGDKYEQEADRMARQVVRTAQSSDTNALQPQHSIAEMPIYLKSIPCSQISIKGSDVDASVERSIERTKGRGQPLPDNLRASMEYAFQTNFSGVRIHANAQSDRLNQSIQAKAFTTGRDIFFRTGVYEPDSQRGQEVLAHELTHVIQQSGIRSQQAYSYQKTGVETKTVPGLIQRMIVTPGYYGNDRQFDYAIMKVLYYIRQYSGENDIHILSQDLDFSQLTKDDTLYIVAHGSVQGIWGHDSEGTKKGWTKENLVALLTREDTGLKTGIKEIRLMACKQGGKDQLVESPVEHLAQNLNIMGIIISGAKGFTFGAPSTQETGFNEVTEPGTYALDKITDEEINKFDAAIEYKKFYGEGKPFATFVDLQDFVLTKNRYVTQLKEILAEYVEGGEDISLVLDQLQDTAFPTIAEEQIEYLRKYGMFREDLGYLWQLAMGGG
jgi:hypothetical protein